MSKKLNTLVDIWHDSYTLIRKSPRLLFPLLIVAFLEGLWLELLYFAPRSPLNGPFLPPIKRYFGEMAAHYPAFLFLLPRLFGFGQLFIYIFVGGILTAITMVMAASLSEGQSLSFSVAFKKVRKRLFSLIVVSCFIILCLGFITGREFTFLKAGFDAAGKGMLYKMLLFLAGIFRYLNFLIAVSVQALVLFILPFLVLENKKLFPAIGRGLLFGGQHFGRVFLLLLAPSLCYSPIWFLKTKTSFLVQKTSTPEAIVWLMGIGILATLLVDAFIAVSAALFYVREKRVS